MKSHTAVSSRKPISGSVPLLPGWRLPLLFAAVFSSWCQAGDAELAGITEGIRGELETQFRASTGLGFRDFDCTYPQGWPDSREILCSATDDEDDRFFYRLLREEGEDEPRVTMKQPVDQLNPEGLAILRQPTDGFLSAFIKKDWDAVMASVSPSFESQLGLEGIRNILAPIHTQMGSAGNPQATYYATPSEGLHQLDYSLTTEPGEALARFRLRLDSGGNPQIVSFLVTAEPGTALHGELLEHTGKAVLGQFFDLPIQRIDGPLEQMVYLGDQEEISLVLADDSRIRARIEQHGSASDMDSNDYRFQILDARTLIGLHLASVGQSVTSIDCPQEVAPDGGSIDCAVTTEGGSVSAIRLMRRGGDHRLMDLE
jgi:hypothetical protein